jgi:hypothetical protein
MMRLTLIAATFAIALSACSVLYDWDSESPANLANACDPSAEDDGHGDCFVGRYCDPDQKICIDTYLPVYRIVPPGYEGTCAEPLVAGCFDPEGTCSIGKREYKADELWLPGGSTLYRTKFPNGAACFYQRINLNGDLTVAERFERSWCISSDQTGNNLCFLNELSSAMIGNIWELSVAAFASDKDGNEIEQGRISFITPDPYGWHHSWKLTCADGDSASFLTEVPPEAEMPPRKPWESDGTARMELFTSPLTVGCEQAAKTDLSEWPLQPDMAPRAEITSDDGFPTGAYSGRGTPVGDNVNGVYFRALHLDHTDALPEFIRGTFVAIWGGETLEHAKLRGMEARRAYLKVYLGDYRFKDSHCSPVLTMDLDAWRASNGLFLPAKLRGCGMDSDFKLCPGETQDCEAE